MEEMMGIGNAISTLVGGGGILPTAASLFTDSAAKKAHKLQRKLLQNQIPDLVSGAEKVGIHPLAALGINPASSNVSATVGGGSGFDAMGANLMQLLGSGMGRNDSAVGQLQLENMQLQNDMLRSQIAGSQAALVKSSGTPNFPGGLESSIGGHKSRFPEGYARDLAQTIGDETAEILMAPGNVVDATLRPSWSGPMADIAKIKGELRNWWNTYQEYVGSVTGVKQR